MNFEEKELSILRKAVDEITSQTGKKIMNSPEITKIINIVEKFLRDKKNNIANNMIDSLDNSNPLPKYNITNINTSISFQNDKSYENYTDKFYKECFTEFLNSEEKANELLSYMKNKRKIKNKIIIKRDFILN